jgi:hypothetical protein
MSSSGSGPGTLPAGTTDSGVAESGARGAVQHRCDTYAALPRELAIPSRIGTIPLSPLRSAAFRPRDPNGIVAQAAAA